VSPSLAVLLLIGIVIGAGAVAATVGFQLAYADRIPAGVRVMGLDLSGRTRVEAHGLLQAEGATLLRRGVTLRAGGQEWEFTARGLGASLEADSLLEEAYGVGREGNPLQRAATQWGALLFGQALSGPALEFERNTQEAALQRIAAEIDRPVENARIELASSRDGVAVVLVPEAVGTRLATAESARRVQAAIAAGLPAVVDLVVETDLPAVTAGDLQAVKSQAERMLASPLSLTFADRRWTISREEIARTLAFERTGGNSVQITVDPDALSGTFDRIAREVDQPPLNARFEWVGGNLRLIRESQDGRGLDRNRLKSLLRERLATEDRAIALPIVATSPAVLSADGPALGIKELIKEGRTAFPGAVPEKRHNIGLAASRLHGTVVPPGGTFSFNREVGPTTLAAGYRTGWGITLSASGAQTIPSVAGGICQVATTLFHPVFHSGYQIEERHSHLYWIQSYGQAPLGMKGLDATVDEDYGVDLQFINPTSDYLLIQARVEGTNLSFGLYGTKPKWDVKIEGPAITNVVSTNRAAVRQADSSLPAGRTLQVEAAEDGFDATVTRTVTQGSDVRTLGLKSHYIPSRNVVLHGPDVEPEPAPPAANPGSAARGLAARPAGGEPEAAPPAASPSSAARGLVARPAGGEPEAAPPAASPGAAE
jgi:vancomycin resistance protein YoaR